MSTWHRHDGSKVSYQNPDQRRQLWLNPQGAAFWAERAFPYIGTASILKIAGNVRMEGEMIRAGWRRVCMPARRNTNG
jgi:hypothetical protein